MTESTTPEDSFRAEGLSLIRRGGLLVPVEVPTHGDEGGNRSRNF